MNGELFAQAVAFEESQDWDAAAAAYKKLLNATPNDAASHINLGTIYYNRQQFELAEVHYRAALAVEPKYALALFDLANVLDETGRTNEAIELYSKAIAIVPTYADAHYNLAIAYTKNFAPLKALPHWKQYVKLDTTKSPWREYAAKQIKIILNAQPLHIVTSNAKPRRTKRRAALRIERMAQ